jgi:hypothetical protein
MVYLSAARARAIQPEEYVKASALMAAAVIFSRFGWVVTAY